MEAPMACQENDNLKKPEKSIEFSLKSDNEKQYDLSIYYISDKLYIKAISQDIFRKKQYSNEYTLDQIKSNKFFFLHENIKEIYQELEPIISKFKKENEILLLEETNKLILRIPLPSVKIKECLFELNEVMISVEQKLEDIFIKFSDIQKDELERFNKYKEDNKEMKELNNNIKQLVTELKEQNEGLKKQNEGLKEQNIEMKNQINELKSQNGELKTQNNELKKNLNEIKNINNSIYEKIQNLSNKSDELKKNIIQEIKDDYKSISNKLMGKINDIYNYIDRKNDEEKEQLNKIKYQKSNELDLIKSWINSTLDTRASIELQLIYKKSRDGDTINDFHRYCDGRGRTVTIIETKEGLKFGGFKNDSWDRKGWKQNKKDFVFSLTRKTKYSHNTDGCSTCSNDDCVLFGNSPSGDICFNKTMNIGYNGNCSFQTNQDLNMKKGYFDAKEIEVYRAIY